MHYSTKINKHTLQVERMLEDKFKKPVSQPTLDLGLCVDETYFCRRNEEINLEQAEYSNLQNKNFC